MYMKKLTKEEFLKKALELAVKNGKDAQKIMKGLLIMGAFEKTESELESLLKSKDTTIDVMIGDLAGALASYFQNINVYRFLNKTKEEFVYYVDSKGIPYAFPKKEYKKQKEKSGVGYV